MSSYESLIWNKLIYLKFVTPINIFEAVLTFFISKFDISIIFNLEHLKNKEFIFSTKDVLK